MKDHSIVLPPSECLLSGEQLTVQLTAMSTFSAVEGVTLEQLKSEELIGSQTETRRSKIGNAELTVIADRFSAERFMYDPVTGVDMGMNRPQLFTMKNP